MIRRVWVFADLRFSAGSPLDREHFLDRIWNLNVTDVAFMINLPSRKKFLLSSSRALWLEEIAWELRAMDVVTHLVTWLRPTERYMIRAAEILRPLCANIVANTGAGSLLFDAEWPWVRNTRGEAGAEAVLKRYWTWFENWPSMLGVTGVAALPSAVKPLASRCDYVLPQAYSVNVSGEPPGLREPGRFQRFAYESWRASRKPMVMGLAAWNLKRPGGISQTTAMQKAITAVEQLTSVYEVAYWSLKHLISSRAQVREAFVQQAAIKARRGISQKMPLASRSFEYEDVRRQRALGYI
jgi:hypothetical protein